jgi:hypothetical protein
MAGAAGNKDGHQFPCCLCDWQDATQRPPSPAMQNPSPRLKQN